LEIARNAQQFYRSRGQTERTALLGFIMPGSVLKDRLVDPTFKPPFDVIHLMAQETKKAAPNLEAVEAR
jgi:hypothetical protein